jgi:hypothetical protein
LKETSSTHRSDKIRESVRERLNGIRKCFLSSLLFAKVFSSVSKKEKILREKGNHRQRKKIAL